MKFVHTIKLVVLFFIFGYIGKLVLGRAVFMTSSYRSAVDVRKMHMKQLEACNHDATYHVFADACIVAKRESGKWPIGIAFGETLEHTHSCIEYPCTDILKEAMQSWVSIIVLSALLFLGILLLLIWTYNRTKVFPGNYVNDYPKEPIVYELSDRNPFLIKKD